MARREQVQAAKQRDKERTEEVGSVDAKDASELKDDLDTLLDEIDGVLEENAEEFVAGYVQKGGE